MLSHSKRLSHIIAVTSEGATTQNYLCRVFDHTFVDELSGDGDKDERNEVFLKVKTLNLLQVIRSILYFTFLVVEALVNVVKSDLKWIHKKRTRGP